MATATAINMRKNAALERIENALPGFEMPRQGNNPDLIMAQQVEAIADWLERHPLAEQPVANGLTKMREMEAAEKPVVLKEWDMPADEPMAVEEEETATAAESAEDTAVDDVPTPRGKSKHK